MTKEEDATVLARHEARAKNCVGLFREENLHHLQQVLGVILEIGIMNRAQFGIRMRQARANGSCFSPIYLMLNKEPFEFAAGKIRERPLEQLQDGCRAIRGAIINDDHLNTLEKIGIAERNQPPQAG